MTATSEHTHSRGGTSTHRALALLSVLIMSTAASLQGLDNVGTTAGQFLKIEVGARATGMGGSFVALADDPSALYWNPAGISLLDGPSFTASHIEWFADITHDFVGFALPFKDGALGISVITLNTGRMEQTTIERLLVHCNRNILCQTDDGPILVRNDGQVYIRKSFQ